MEAHMLAKGSDSKTEGMVELEGAYVDRSRNRRFVNPFLVLGDDCVLA
jgi:hypothetical protein